jgi:dolichol-phosphate mannosyltransferase
MLSVVAPIYNERELLDRFHLALGKALAAIGEDWELILVDDGSTDGTDAALQALAQKDARVKVVSLTRNFGHQGAIARGLEFARGDWVAVIHSDLEDRPEDIPKLLAKAKEGHDVVYAVRGSAHKTWLKDLGSRAFYWLIQNISETTIPARTGDFCVMSRAVASAVTLLPERHRYLPGLRTWVGFDQTGLALPRVPRAGGEPKQSYGRLVLHAFDAIFSFSTVPLKLLSLLGFAAFSVGLAGAALVLLWRLVGADVPLGWTSMMVMLFFFGGIQLLGMGVLGAYLARIYDEVRGRPSTLVKRVIPHEPRP